MELIFENDSETPSGHICKCGKFHRWALWVYSHSHEVIQFTCPDCGAIVIIHELDIMTEAEYKENF